MKEQWKLNEGKLVALEEGLQYEKQESVKKPKYGISCCKQSMRNVKLILYVELILFVAWSCYMISPIYRSQVNENDITKSIRGKFSPMSDSQSIVDSNTQISSIFIKPGNLEDKVKTLLKTIKEQDILNTIDMHNSVHTSTQNLITAQNNDLEEASKIDSLIKSSSDIEHNKKFLQKSILQKTDYIDKIINIDEQEESTYDPQFLKQLEDAATSKKENNLEEFRNANNLIENTNQLTLNTNGEHVLDTSLHIFESLESDITALSNSSSDVVNTAQADGSKETSFNVGDVKSVNIHTGLQHKPIKYFPPHELLDFSRIYLNDFSKISSVPNIVSVKEDLQHNQNGKGDALNDDIVAGNENEYDVNDSNALASTSSDVSTSESDPRSSFGKLMAIAQNTEYQHLSEITIDTKEDEKHELTEDTTDLFDLSLSQSEVQDSIEFSTPNINIIHWFNSPARFASNLPSGLEDELKSREKQNPLFWDKDTEIIDDFIPGHKCQLKLEMDILRVKCPSIEFNEEWSLSSSDEYVSDIPDVTDYGDVSDDYYTECDENAAEQLEDKSISNEHINIKEGVVTREESAFTIKNTTELYENIPTNAKTLNDKLVNLSETVKMDSFDNTEVIQEDATFNSNDEIKTITTMSSFISENSLKIKTDSNDTDSENEQRILSEIFDVQKQQEQETFEDSTFSEFENINNLLDITKRMQTLQDKLTSIYKNDILNIMKQQNIRPQNFLQTWDGYLYDFCNSPYRCSQFPYSWRQQQTDNLKTFLENIRSSDFPDNFENDSNNRKKRVANNVIWRKEQISNGLDENNGLMDILQDRISQEQNNKIIENSLRKLFQKMEVLAAHIDGLHERYLDLNKLDNDYISSEIPMETEDRGIS